MTSQNQHNHPELLANPYDFRDACGVGFIATRHNEATHEIVKKSIEALGNLAHRGAVDADGKTGDGAGLLTGIPKEFYIRKAKEAGVILNPEQDLALAMVFYPQNHAEEEACRRIMKSVLRKFEVKVLWEREVPIDTTVLGTKALSVMPKIAQLILSGSPLHTIDEFEQVLFLARKEIETLVKDLSYHDFYVPSLSARTIVHKGLFMGRDVHKFYLDLQEVDFVSSFAIFHQRFSTNTFPSWALAHPFRMMAHNGEINTIRANRNWMQARECAEQPKSWVPEGHSLKQFIMAGSSDSSTVDNALETYVFGGRSIMHSMVHMMPEPWQNQAILDEDLRSFYEYHACISENWDGPAAISFSDGKIVGAIVDRNGLRPARYKITKDYLIVSSEVGCIHIPDEEVIENGKLSPGKIIAINIKRKKILRNDDVKFLLADRQTYSEWVQKRIYKVNETLKARGINVFKEDSLLTDEQALVYKKAFGYSQEDIDLVLTPMFRDAQEAVGSMGDDTPLAVFSEKPRLLYSYFKQLFAQVTNPPIDPIRERYVTSLRMYLGKSQNIFLETPKHAQQIRVRGPIVSRTVFDDIRNHPDFPSATLMARFAVTEGPATLEDMLWDLRLAAEKAVESGKVLIIITDRYIDKMNAPIPMLLAVSSVHQHLVRIGKRTDVSILVETGEARETHHFACLIGYGASVIYPYVAMKQAVDFGNDPKNGITPEQAVKNYVYASEKGILKIMSKMGISVLQAYHAAQIFEALGIKNSVAKFHFQGTPCKISGADLTDIANDYLIWHKEAFAEAPEKTLDAGGFYRFRREGEYHGYNPDVVKALHQAVIGTDKSAYQKYSDLVTSRKPMTIRDLLMIKKGTPVALDQIESKEKIVQRFCTPGISYGAISKETHETFAIAMNRIGAKSDSGEGGEDPARFKRQPNGDSTNSEIKQVASGRFGVTAYYLSQAGELEIKVAQGAKPGEGGQLPGKKVSADIARVRHSTPGVTLISPPPHHDIYSIEDLAQLIYDLKQSNPKARVSVKLVSEDGVGTIAAGVVKAHADVILISGHDGGTGASPLSSIKNAGLPWELGIAETQQVLVRNKLRDRVLLRVDGGFRTGYDVVKAALLGAEEYGFGTASMIAAGCVMVRQCHLNTCPVGVATQDPILRGKFKGTPERVVNLFYFVAEEVRQILSEMGFKNLTDIIGRVDLLEQMHDLQGEKIKKINLSRLLTRPDTSGNESLHRIQLRNDWIDDVSFDERIKKDFQDVFTTGKGEIEKDYEVCNADRSVGTRLSYEIVNRFGPEGLPQGKITLHLAGVVGQSFGAFAMKTLTLRLEGEANDYVGKGLSGAIVSVKPSRYATFKPEENIICGNTCLYGATSGKLFVNGRAGERFAVRNSGASAVVEGIGDHGCEYMTGGSVLILGSVGNNFGAGMTGGIAYVYNPGNIFKKFCNPNDVEILDVDWRTDESWQFLDLLGEHIQYTDSPLARRLVADWDNEKLHFVRVVPKEMLKMKQSQTDEKRA